MQCRGCTLVRSKTISRRLASSLRPTLVSPCWRRAKVGCRTRMPMASGQYGPRCHQWGWSQGSASRAYRYTCKTRPYHFSTGSIKASDQGTPQSHEHVTPQLADPRAQPTGTVITVSRYSGDVPGTSPCAQARLNQASAGSSKTKHRAQRHTGHLTHKTKLVASHAGKALALNLYAF